MVSSWKLETSATVTESSSGFHRHLGIRDTNVANHENTFIVCFHDLPGQPCRCRLAIGSGDGCQSALRALICQLDLTPDRDLGFIQHCPQMAPPAEFQD